MCYCRILFLSVVCMGWFPQVSAADVPVTVGDNFFNPRKVTNNVNDRVVWTWTGISSHTSTSSGSPRLWDSGLMSSGTFAYVFTTTGTFNYYCIPHAKQFLMFGSVTVQGGNTPPTVTITSPANNAVLIAPATFTVTVNASDPGGSVSQVEFFRDTTSLGTDTISPYSTNVNNLAAGTYTISAVATDNLGAQATNSITLIINAPPTVTLTDPTNGAIFAAPATVAIQASATDTDGTISQMQFLTNSASLLFDTAEPYEATAVNLPAGTYNLLAVATDNRNASATSSVATISVVNPVDVVLSGVQRLSGTNFQFRYTANPGLRYVVECSPILTNWSSVATNRASGASESFTDAINTDRNFYRVRRLPNP
jgi:plastocyanin